MNVSMTLQGTIQIVIPILSLAATLIVTISSVKQYRAMKRSRQGKANRKRKGEKKNWFNASVKGGPFSAKVSWTSEDKKEEG